MKTKILQILILAGGILGFSGCTDWLDTTPTDRVTDKIVWTDANSVQLYVNGFYTYINVYGQFGGSGTNLGLTEGLTETLKYGSSVAGPHAGHPNTFAYALGGTSAPNASHFLGDWTNLYNRIRRVNEFLYTQKKFSKLSDADNIRFQAEARFFRAFLYFELIKRSKDVILMDENLDKIQRNTPLSTEAQGWDMVEKDFNYAAQNLPPKWASAQSGRVTKGAAYAMLSRAMLYAGRWQACKDAAGEVMKLGYDLVPGTTADAYKNAFKSGSIESILEFNYLKAGPSHGFDLRFTPGCDNALSQGAGTPTQEMVESYEKAGGGVVDWTPWHAAGGSTATPPYASLEPRFHASVLYDGAMWKGKAIETYVGAKTGWVPYDDATQPASGRTTTGYFLRKLVDETHTDLASNSPSVQPWIAIRLAEVLLNHAEACYRLNDPTSANADILRVRDRVGLSYNPQSGTALFDAIRQERKIELAYEGHLYWDMRRWKLAHTAYSNMRVHGLKISVTDSGKKYEYVAADSYNRTFLEKLYRIPLPEGELTANSAVEQYPEWK